MYVRTSEHEALKEIINGFTAWLDDNQDRASYKVYRVAVKLLQRLEDQNDSVEGDSEAP